MSAVIEASVYALGRALSGRVWRGSTEADVQRAIAKVLADPDNLRGPHPSYRVEREFKLSDAERVDFAIVLESREPDVIAIEVKLEARALPTLRQVQRYAAHARVGAIILATTSSVLAAQCRGQLHGKRIYPLVLRRI